jgi:hypothetical protein
MAPLPEFAAPADIVMHRVRIENCEYESTLIGLSKTAYRVLCIDMFSGSATLSLASGAVRALRMRREAGAARADSFNFRGEECLYEFWSPTTIQWFVKGSARF